MHVNVLECARECCFVCARECGPGHEVCSCLHACERTCVCVSVAVFVSILLAWPVCVRIPVLSPLRPD